MSSRAAQGIFIAGTDTGVGKTLVAAALIRALKQHGSRAVGMKPVAAGAQQTPDGLRNTDALALIEASGIATPYDRVNPFCFAAPISPHIAAHDAGIPVDIDLIRQRFADLTKTADFVVVEGAGGWLAPVGPTLTMADIAAALDLPILLVVGLRLGCLNHTLLTTQSIEASGLRLAAWIGNHIDAHFERDRENLETLQERLGHAPLDVWRFDAAVPERLALSSEAQRQIHKLLGLKDKEFSQAKFLS